MQRLPQAVSVRRRYEQVAGLYHVLRRFGARSKLRYKVGPLLPLALTNGQSVEIGVIEYLVVLGDTSDTPQIDDDSDLAAGSSLSGEPEERARRFLVDHYSVFSFLPDDDQSARRKFDAQLFLKHSLRSRMGAHCIFGWRIGSVEVPANCFIVHLDPDNRLVMVSSTYQPDTELSDIDLSPDDCKAQLRQLLDTYKGSIAGQPIIEPVLVVRDWRSQAYAYRLRVKLTIKDEQHDGSCVWLIGPQGIERDYRDSVRAAAGPIGLARVYQD